jgi:capsular exopolysaccharide synthesis family protein
LLGVIAGLGCGVGLAFLLENLDTSLYSVNRIEEVTGLSTLGRIPNLQQQKQATFMNGNTPEGEAFRHLRTMLFAIGRDKTLRSILVTSAEPDEGKSTIISNLALTLAQSGKQVVVLDGDLRLPIMHKTFDLPNECGLSSVLKQEATLDEALQQSVIPGISVLTSGPLPSNPAELLSSSHMSNVLEELTQTFDITLVDAPAVLAVTDATVLALIADGVMLVVRRGVSRQEAVQEACLQLMHIKARIVGVVINGMEFSTSSAAQEYYHTAKA